jgi:hypothetical protein
MFVILSIWELLSRKQRRTIFSPCSIVTLFCEKKALYEELGFECKSNLEKYYEDLKNDPERLTTEFLLEMTSCECKRKKN